MSIPWHIESPVSRKPICGAIGTAPSFGGIDAAYWSVTAGYGGVPCKSCVKQAAFVMLECVAAEAA